MTPPSSLDPCLTPSDAVAIKLKSYVIGEGNPLDGFLNKGELSQAVQLSLSVLKSANEKNDCGQELDPSVKALVRYTQCFITLKKLSSSSLFLFTRIGT